MGRLLFVAQLRSALTGAGRHGFLPTRAHPFLARAAESQAERHSLALLRVSAVEPVATLTFQAIVHNLEWGRHSRKSTSAMARVTSNMIHVPPLGCVWLMSSDVTGLDTSGFAVSFEARASSDVTIQLAPQSGGSHYSYNVDHNNTLQSGYTVVFGSHSNTRFRVFGSTREPVDVKAPTYVEGAVASNKFNKYWLCVVDDTLRVGTGSLDNEGTVLAEIKEDGLLHTTKHLALSTWDTAVSYKDIKVSEPVLDLQSPRPPSSIRVEDGEANGSFRDMGSDCPLNLASFLGEKNLEDVVVHTPTDDI